MNLNIMKIINVGMLEERVMVTTLTPINCICLVGRSPGPPSPLHEASVLRCGREGVGVGRVMNLPCHDLS